MHPMELLDDMGHVESLSVHFEMELVLMSDRCTICAKRTIGLDIVLDAPDGIPRWRGPCGILFGPFGDGVSVDIRKVHGLH